MKIIDPSFEILFDEKHDYSLQKIEIAGRTCYKSENKITDDSASGFVRKIIASGHHSVIEHVYKTVKFICDRGVSHELVRHRLASFSQESTRYANYSKDKFGNEITVIRPYFWNENDDRYSIWLESMRMAEESYLKLIKVGARPEEARSVLPNSLKTEIVVSCNIREWRHILNLRCSNAAHPQIRQIMLPLLKEFYDRYSVLFDDLYAKHINAR
ncbi:MAG: FAD-dependent thymidylate synthase [Bacteroidales bacterium]